MNKLKQFYFLIRPFWRSSQSIIAWLLLIATITLSLISIWFNILINEWNGQFFNALQKLDSTALYNLLWEFLLLIGILILLVVYADYLRKKLLIKWRNWMTEQITQKWLAKNGQHYHLQIRKLEPDNPDQRIAEDIQLLISQSLSLLISFLTSLLTFISFSMILWNLSGSISFSIFGITITIPGYMFFVCILYVAVGILLTHVIGRKLHGINIEKQKNEANYRSALINCRENSDTIAGQHGQAQEQAKLQNYFLAIIHNWYQLIKKERNLLFFVNGFNHLSSLAPIFFALPKFIANAIQLGGLMQIRMAFIQLNSALSWFIFCYKDIAIWQATVTRLYNFVILLEEPIESNVKKCDDKSEFLLDVTNLQVMSANNAPLVSFSCQLKAGQSIIIAGVSGIGKSTLLKCLAGFWPYFSGSIYRTDNYIWMPQNNYIGSGKLADLISYPKSAENYNQSQLEEALIFAGLNKLVFELLHHDNWETRLSGGEKQRLLLARLYLNKPDLLLLDEITSGLDIQNAIIMIDRLKEALPHSAIVFVSHQSELQNQVNAVINIK
ncbi:ABC transporter ATP-binding protein/permease [uncultured Gilliamella sp.]|uniref:ABC transporter ATP-binding protein/permease n=1 Tax=uncultured Gilliamella sp. TaxID=1193505 RepID=UPI0025DB5A36|nr:ABC transporter ATP-binding protein/permease [uncultured Gilliamella sp.]